MEVYVLIVTSDGSPGQMYGPYSYEDAKEIVVKVLRSNKTENGPVEIDSTVLESIELNGMYEYEFGGGVYIISYETFDE